METSEDIVGHKIDHYFFFRGNKGAESRAIVKQLLKGAYLKEEKSPLISIVNLLYNI